MEMSIDGLDLYFNKLINLQQLSTVEGYENHFLLMHRLVVEKYWYIEEQYYVDCCVQGFITEIREFVQIFSPSSLEAYFKLAKMKETILGIVVAPNPELSSSNKVIPSSSGPDKYPYDVTVDDDKCNLDEANDFSATVENYESVLENNNDTVVVKDDDSGLDITNVSETVYCDFVAQSDAINGSVICSLDSPLVKNDMSVVDQQNEALVVPNIVLSQTVSEVVATSEKFADKDCWLLLYQKDLCQMILSSKLLAFKGGTYKLPHLHSEDSFGLSSSGRHILTGAVSSILQLPSCKSVSRSVTLPICYEVRAWATRDFDPGITPQNAICVVSPVTFLMWFNRDMLHNLLNEFSYLVQQWLEELRQMRICRIGIVTYIAFVPICWSYRSVFLTQSCNESRGCSASNSSSRVLYRQYHMEEITTFFDIHGDNFSYGWITLEGWLPPAMGSHFSGKGLVSCSVQRFDFTLSNCLPPTIVPCLESPIVSINSGDYNPVKSFMMVSTPLKGRVVSMYLFDPGINCSMPNIYRVGLWCTFLRWNKPHLVVATLQKLGQTSYSPVLYFYLVQSHSIQYTCLHNAFLVIIYVYVDIKKMQILITWLFDPGISHGCLVNSGCKTWAITIIKRQNWFEELYSVLVDDHSTDEILIHLKFKNDRGSKPWDAAMLYGLPTLQIHDISSHMNIILKCVKPGAAIVSSTLVQTVIQGARGSSMILVAITGLTWRNTNVTYFIWGVVARYHAKSASGGVDYYSNSQGKGGTHCLKMARMLLGSLRVCRLSPSTLLHFKIPLWLTKAMTLNTSVTLLSSGVQFLFLGYEHALIGTTVMLKLPEWQSTLHLDAPGYQKGCARVWDEHSEASFAFVLISAILLSVFRLLLWTYGVGLSCYYTRFIVISPIIIVTAKCEKSTSLTKDYKDAFGDPLSYSAGYWSKQRVTRRSALGSRQLSQSLPAVALPGIYGLILCTTNNGCECSMLYSSSTANSTLSRIASGDPLLVFRQSITSRPMQNLPTSVRCQLYVHGHKTEQWKGLYTTEGADNFLMWEWRLLVRTGTLVALLWRIAWSIFSYTYCTAWMLEDGGTLLICAMVFCSDSH